MNKEKVVKPLIWVSSSAILVLHAFQKKSKKGIETPKQDMTLIHSRLKLAEELYKVWKKGAKNHD